MLYWWISGVLVLQGNKSALVLRHSSFRYLFLLYFSSIPSLFTLHTRITYSTTDCVVYVAWVWMEYFKTLSVSISSVPFLQCWWWILVSYVGMGIWALFSTFPSSRVVGLPKWCRYWWENWYLVVGMHFVCNNVSNTYKCTSTMFAFILQTLLFHRSVISQFFNFHFIITWSWGLFFFDDTSFKLFLFCEVSSFPFLKSWNEFIFELHASHSASWM